MFAGNSPTAGRQRASNRSSEKADILELTAGQEGHSTKFESRQTLAEEYVQISIQNGVEG